MSLVWVSRSGTVTPSTLLPGPYGRPRLSPDGQRVALNTLARGTFIHDLARGGLMLVAPGRIWPTLLPPGLDHGVSDSRTEAENMVET
jgi:hypothetical protein